MATQEIAREEWFPFFDAFSGMHRGWLVTVEVATPDGTEVKAYEVPLAEIQADIGASVRDDRISVALQEADASELWHVVKQPRAVRLREGERGGDGAVEIESDSGTTTFIRYKHLPLPKDTGDLFA